MNFQINPFQYFDKKLSQEKCVERNFFDFTDIIKQRKAYYPNHFFLVTENGKVQMLDSFLLNFLKIDYYKNTLTIHIHSQISQPIYWIDIQNQKNNWTTLTIDENIEQTIIHEDVISEKSQTQLVIKNTGDLHYFNLINSHTQQLFHKEIECDNYGQLTAFFMQKEDSSLIKIDTQLRLYEKAIANINYLTVLQQHQLRDDCIEIEHIEPNTNCSTNYQSLNNGKAVSQINNIITKESLNSELTQKIKHILMSETGQSFSKPNLMIHAPTVASHGNTMSSFPEEWLFYLYQKGVTKDKAKAIIKQSIIKNFCSSTPYEEQFVNYFIGA
jgi:Fe-S cluster assembly scaffold protein SufB